MAALCHSERVRLGDSPEPWMMQGTPRSLMNKKYPIRLTCPERDDLLRYLRFLLFKSYLPRVGQALGCRQRHQLNVRLIFEQKGTKETEEDPIPFCFVVSRSLTPTSSIGRNARSELASV